MTFKDPLGADELQRLREHFPIPDKPTTLAHHTLAAMPHQYARALHR
mgnify:CR=1 FL=1